MRTPSDEPDKAIHPQSQPGPTPDDFDYTSEDAANRRFDLQDPFDLQDTHSDYPEPLRFRAPRFDYEKRGPAAPVPWWLVILLMALLAGGAFWLGYEVAIYREVTAR